jgi:hypothetical protein
MLHVGISLGSLTQDNGRILRNPLFEPPPLRIFNQEEINEESADIGVEEERVEGKKKIGVKKRLKSTILHKQESRYQYQYHQQLVASQEDTILERV